MKHKGKWKRVAGFLPLAVFAILEVSPLLFLLAGTFMEDQEIVDQMKKRVIAMHRGVIISDERKAGYIQHAN